MQCPSCDAIVKEMKFGQFNVFGCKPCDGFWIARKDTEHLLDHLLSLKNNGKKFMEISPDEKEILNGMYGRYCPSCNGSTTSFVWGDSGASSFECVRGCGVWVRMKQLGDIIEWWEINSLSRPRASLFPPNDIKTEILSTDTNIVKGILGFMSDDQGVLSTPWATISLIFLNIICFIISLIIPPYKFLQMMFVPQYFFSNPFEQFYTIYTSMFLHADFYHIFGNMFFLFVFGKSLESRIGRIKFVAVYLLSGLTASIGYAFLTSNPLIPTLGASGAVSGILGSYMCLFPRAKISIHKFIFWIWLPIKITLPAWFYLGLWFLGQQLLGVAAGSGNIAWFAHLSGFVFGFLILLVLKISNKL